MPPEEQSMTSTPSAFSSLANAMVSSSDQPPSTSSIDERRTKSGFSARQVGVGERTVAVPRARHARLAAGVRKLDGGQRALALHEARDARQPGHVRVIPYAGVAVRDASARLDGGRLDEDDAGATLREF